MHDDQPPFPEIDVSFFRDYGVKPSKSTYVKWQQFLKSHPRIKDRSKYVHCLGLCAGVGDSLVEKWLSSKIGDHKHIGEAHKEIFRKATVALGWRGPRPEAEDTTLAVHKVMGPIRLALFTSLSVVSESYHLAVIRSIIRSATTQGLLLSVHELAWTHPISDEQANQAGLIVTRYAPNAVLMVRLTPSSRFLEQMTFGGRPLPVLLIHADRQRYPPPVLANVVPDHESNLGLQGWLWSRRHIRGHKMPSVVLVAMKEEVEQTTFPALPGIPRSIRNHRIAAIERELEGAEVVRFQVDDYSSRHAFAVWERHPSADAYVCLSDQIAVGIKNLLRCRGHSEEDCRERIVGVDGSPLAREARIASLSQGLEEIGKGALDRLCAFLDQYEGRKFVFPPQAEEIPATVRLVEH
jgi:DNA-binding LacI/PurR family transcriptional regulator